MSHWSHQCTSSAKNSWGCYLNHYSPASCTSSGVNVWPLRALFNGPELRKLHGNKPRLYSGCLSTSHYTVFSSEICGLHGDGHCPAAGLRHVITKLTWTFVLDLGMMIPKYLTVMVCNDHVVNVIQIPEAEVPQCKRKSSLYKCMMWISSVKIKCTVSIAYLLLFLFTGTIYWHHSS